MIHTFFLQDLLLVTLLLAVAIMPLAQFASRSKGRARLPRLTNGSKDHDGTQRGPKVGDGVLAGAGAGASGG